MILPESSRELAEALAAAASSGKSIRLYGAASKNAMGGAIAPADVEISTCALRRVLAYEPMDLTISVEAGLPFDEFSRVLAANRQMVPLDPPCQERATVGGVIATNSSGPRRRLYGTARDCVIGMQFVTLEGKLVQSGGMVVKNVAGLDMAKLMIGSFGTLAAVAVVNFKLIPMPADTRTFVRSFDSPEAAVAARDAMLRSVLQPAAIDLLNPAAAARLGRERWLLLTRAGGSAGVLDRYARELADAEALEGYQENELWTRIREFVPEFLDGHPRGAVVRISTTLAGLGGVLAAVDATLLARAGSGVCYACFAEHDDAIAWLAQPRPDYCKCVLEWGPPERGTKAPPWPFPGSDLAMMEQIKSMFDPTRLLNRGRLYGRL